MKVTLQICWALATLLLLPAPPAGPQAYPTRPIKWIVPFPPGASTDTLTRMLSEQMSRRIGQPVLMEFRPGAGEMRCPNRLWPHTAFL